jgi:transcriptional regulator NrdR family protein
VNCPLCSSDTFVRDTRDGERRRECTRCRHRFTTVEILKDRVRELELAGQVVLEAAERLKTPA